MAKKKKIEKNFIDEVSRFSKHEDLKVGDVVVYQRVSDKKNSVGEIKWFCMSSAGMCAQMIDLNLGNFQLGLCSSVDRSPKKGALEKLLKRNKIK